LQQLNKDKTMPMLVQATREKLLADIQFSDQQYTVETCYPISSFEIKSGLDLKRWLLHEVPPNTVVSFVVTVPDCSLEDGYLKVGRLKEQLKNVHDDTKVYFDKITDSWKTRKILWEKHKYGDIYNEGIRALYGFETTAEDGETVFLITAHY
jgi:hypothetical protein